MISNLEIITACQAVYHNPSSFPPPKGSDVYVRVSRGSDGKTLIVSIRGSITPIDWFRDFLFVPIEMIGHPEMGHVHAGFLNGVMVIVDIIENAVGDDPYVIGGHSLGGGEGVGLGCAMLLRNKPPQKIVTCGAPRFGMQPFVDLMKHLDLTQLRRGNDPVPTVPWDIPPDFEFLDTTVQTPVGVAQRNPFECHHIDGYVADAAEIYK